MERVVDGSGATFCKQYFVSLFAYFHLFCCINHLFFSKTLCHFFLLCDVMEANFDFFIILVESNVPYFCVSDKNSSAKFKVVNRWINMQ